MRKNFHCFLFVLFFVLCQAIQAQFYFAHKLNYGSMSGSTSYEIVASDIILGIPVSIRSKLDFPLDIKMVGLENTVYYIWDSKKTLQFDLKLYKDLTDPSEKMTDEDWVSIIGLTEKFSSTKSIAKNNAFIIDGGAYLNYSLSPKLLFTGGLGYRYQKYLFDIYGVEGWQLNEDLERVYFDTLSNKKVLDYEITYFLPSIKIGGVYDAIENVKLNANVAYSPLAEVVDRDDHLLRGKLVKGKCNEGSATIFDFGLHWNISPKIFMNLNYEHFSLSLKGEQRQYFYADDPSTEDNEQGTRFTDINLEINSSYSTYRLGIGYHL